MSYYILGGKNKILPSVPTREQVCGVNLTFQGLTVPTTQHGLLAWFEPAIICLNSQDRQNVYSAKKAAGDTHLITEFWSSSRSVYDEVEPYIDFIAPNCEIETSFFLQTVVEAIMAGFCPVISLDGDNGDNSPYGSANATRQLPILVDLLKSNQYGDLTKYCLIARFWDGVFYGSSPDNIAAFGVLFRQLLPNGYLAIEHNEGHIPLGNGVADWAPDGPMSTYDTLCSEFDYSNDTGPNDTLWQVAGRTVRPYNRPPDQPVNDDPNPPYYFQFGAQYNGVKRGEFFACGFEWDGEYSFVRGNSTPSQEMERRNYIRGLGYKYTG